MIADLTTGLSKPKVQPKDEMMKMMEKRGVSKTTTTLVCACGNGRGIM